MKPMTLPEIRRALRVAARMTESPDPEIRAWARQLLRDAGEPGVSIAELLEPIWNRPLSELTRPERTLRILAA